MSKLRELAEQIFETPSTDLTELGEDMQSILVRPARESGAFPGIRMKGEIAPEGFAQLIRLWAEERLASSRDYDKAMGRIYVAFLDYKKDSCSSDALGVAEAADKLAGVLQEVFPKKGPDE